MSVQDKNAAAIARGQRWLLTTVLLVVILLVSSPAGATQAQRDDEQLQEIELPLAALQVPDLQNDVSAFSSAHPKMDSVLIEASEKSLSSKQSTELFADNRDLRIDNEMIQIKVITTEGSSDQASSAVAAAGGIVTFSSDLEPLLQAWVPLSALGTIAESRAVHYLAAPSYTAELEVAAADAQSEALPAMNAQVWHNAGFDGRDVRIAIIDGSFGGYRSLLGSELPPNVFVKNFVDGQSDGDIGNESSVHGTASAEIAADIAPQATFYLLKISTDLDLEQAVDYAIRQGVDVISTSLAWYNLTPGDGGGYFDDLARKAREKGIVWLTAGGNDRESHWGGPFNDPDSNGYHNFSGNQEVNYFGPGNGNAYLIDPGLPLSVFVRWDDWDRVREDYKLWVVRWNGSAWQVVGSSNRPQFGLFWQTPAEGVSIVTTGSPAPYGFVIERINGNRNVNLEIFAPKRKRLDELVMDRSLPNLADASHVVTVGGLSAFWPFSLEYFSSQGPTNGPGGIANNGITKPDFAGFSGVSTTSYGFRAFSGTSASAPHAAGAAALIKDAFSLYAAQDIENYLAQTAIDMGESGMDNIYGHGRLYLGNPPQKPPVSAYYNYLPLSQG